jgi:hypothetical protein
LTTNLLHEFFREQLSGQKLKPIHAEKRESNIQIGQA